MKTTFLKLLFISITLTKAASASSCPSTDDRQNLGHWVCELGSEMALRDAGADYTRQAELFSAAAQIKAVRAGLIGGETCRSFNQTNLTVAFHRILQHQSLQRSLFPQISESAASEILNESARGKVDVCESQLLSSENLDHTYENLYYFKYGPARESKHFLIRITNRWQH